MNLRRVLAILGKDLKDTMRDGRIVVLVLLPIGIALMYNATIDDNDELPSTKVAIVDPADRGLARELRQATDKSGKLEITEVRDAGAARKLVAEANVDIAVVTPVDKAGPERTNVLVGRDAPPAAQAVVALVPTALARVDGRAPPAQTPISSVPPTEQKPYEKMGAKPLAILIAILMLVSFVALLVAPIQMAEELETGTFGALRLAATGPEILAAKAIVGFLLSLVGVAIIVQVTGLEVNDPPLFFAAVLALTVSLVGFGLLLGLLIRNANVINSYGAFLLFPFLGLAIAVYFVESGVFLAILDLLPFSQAAKLLGDGISAEAPFGAGLASWAVIAAWAVAGYLVLARIAVRREI